jgi:vacuolar-type H+-ATPase subunit I/STV1
MEYSQKIVVSLDYCYYGSFEKQFFDIINQAKDITYTERVSLELWIAADKLADFIAQVDNLSLGTAIIECREVGYVPQR